jgi:hypothetical protein
MYLTREPLPGDPTCITKQSVCFPTAAPGSKRLAWVTEEFGRNPDINFAPHRTGSHSRERQHIVAIGDVPESVLLVSICQHRRIAPNGPTCTCMVPLGLYINLRVSPVGQIGILLEVPDESVGSQHAPA